MKKPFSPKPMVINNWFPSSCLGIIAFKTIPNIEQLHSQTRAWKRAKLSCCYIQENYLIFCLNKKPFSLNPMVINNWFPSSCLGIIAFKTSSNIKQLHSQARAWKRAKLSCCYIQKKLFNFLLK
jgi:hypothetical protein